MITGNDFKRARAQSGLTQEEFAEQIGLSARTLCRYENGECLKKCNKYYKLFQDLGWTEQGKSKGK